MFSQVISDFAAEGRACFSFEELRQRINSSPQALKSALRRSLKKGEIAMPLRGFCVIVPPEYRAMACLPAEQFIPDMMAHLGEAYYAGLLSAAQYHGAAHQRPQVFQVVVSKPRRKIECGRVRVDFIVRKNADAIPTQFRNTPAGVLKLSTPEATAFDLVGYYKQCGWLDNVATVLTELVEKIDPGKLVEVAELSPLAWGQRLGFLLTLIGASEIAKPLAEYVLDKNPVRTPLLPSAGLQGVKFDNCWRVFVNVEVEAEV
jgi:predicted transcriptional regulator of viral defense system